MEDEELFGRLGEWVGFERYGRECRGRLLGIDRDTREPDVRVIVELPLTLLKISLPSRDVRRLTR
jgi:hypothetical protein